MIINGQKKNDVRVILCMKYPKEYRAKNVCKKNKIPNDLFEKEMKKYKSNNMTKEEKKNI